jgi:hypothetical protein
MDDTKPRAKSKRQPFCWQEKHVLRTIRDVFENEPGPTSSAIAIYTALTELASDYKSITFDTSQATIAQRAGLSVRTVRTVLSVFKKLGFVAIKRNQVDGLERQSSYSIIRGYEPLGNHCRALGKRTSFHLPTSEECTEECKEEHSSNEEHSFSNKKESTRLSLTRQTPPPFFLLSKRERKKKSSSSLNGYTADELAVLEYYNRELVPLGWFRVNQYRDSVRDAIALRDLDDWREVIDLTKAHESLWPARRTFVRLNWSNY